MRARSFFYACGGILLLVIAYTIGAATAQGQLEGDPVVGISNSSNDTVHAITASGRLWQYIKNTQQWVEHQPIPGSTLDVEDANLSDVKKRYREEDD